MHHTGERYARRYCISSQLDGEQNSDDDLMYHAGDNKEAANRYLSEEIFSEDINFNNLMENKSYLHYNDLEVRQARHEYLSRLKSSRTLNQHQRLDSNKNSNSESTDYRNGDRVCYILPSNMNGDIQSRRPSAEMLRRRNTTSSPKSDTGTLPAQNYQELLRSKEVRDRIDDSSPFNETKSAPISQNNSEKIVDVEKSIQSHHFEEGLSTKGSGTLKHNQKCKPEDVKVTYKNEAFKKVSSQTDTREVLKNRSGRKVDNFSGTTFIHHKENSDGLATYSPKILSEFAQPHESPSRRSMQTVQSKKYDDLIKLELSKCTIMSVIYDCLQKCEQSKYEVLPNEKNLSNVTAERIQRKVEEEPSPSISIAKLDTGSNTEIVTADLLSNVFKDIRDIHLQNILHAVKCIQYVENIPKKYGGKRGI